ncbi:hypothetical protein BOTBODRAFT_32920 [Botryobasidium botryosum FD-172 SS1]|uniref:Pentacotripeptide-repeat region of PRORP domain-containing protein n=1 Tax=Botryobasidium botryosum (strain FD-172 SS1) TaxID=930990 RepID=A0A067MED2_BOTB1|nr:hypothetical protein BOTBODRAFT_32920 [Botryobasidium botryosum FD-172 SS1]
MIPKVAAHFLHFSRAAAAVQNQAQQSLRNVLQFQSAIPASASPSVGASGSVGWGGASSSSWGSAGGAKYHAGSRFYNGYTGAGRAITQANSSNTDGNNSTTDDAEERPLYMSRRSTSGTAGARTRMRSHSISFSAQERRERGDKLGVLEVVQMHARYRHAFAANSAISDPPLAILPNLVSSQAIPDPDEPSPSRVLVRRNSTSAATDAPLSESHDIPPTLLQPGLDANVGSEMYGIPSDTNARALWTAMTTAMEEMDFGRVKECVAQILQAPAAYPIQVYHRAIEALMHVNGNQKLVHDILLIYQSMLSKNVVPNNHTYQLLLVVLCKRDGVVMLAIDSLGLRKKVLGDLEEVGSALEAHAIACRKMEEEQCLESALALFETASNRPHFELPVFAFNLLIQSCAQRGLINEAIRIFSVLEKQPHSRPNAWTYAYLVSTFAAGNDPEGAREVFDELLRNLEGPKRASIIAPKSASRAIAQAWDMMAKAYFRAGRPEEAITLLELMMDAPATAASELSRIPRPTSATFTIFIERFCDLGDVDSAFTWFNRVLEQSSVKPAEGDHSYYPPPPHSAAWALILSALARHGRHEEFNQLFHTHVGDSIRRNESIGNDVYSLFLHSNLRTLRGLDRADGQFSTILGMMLDILPKIPMDTPTLGEHRQEATLRLVEVAVEAGRPGDAARSLCRMLQASLRPWSDLTHRPVRPDQIQARMRQLRPLLISAVQCFFGLGQYGPPPLPIDVRSALSLARLGERFELDIFADTCHDIVQLYVEEKAKAVPGKFSKNDWVGLTKAFCAAEMSKSKAGGEAHMETFLKDLEALDPSILGGPHKEALGQALTMTRGREKAAELMRGLLPQDSASEAASNENEVPSTAPTSPADIKMEAEAVNTEASSLESSAPSIDMRESHKLERFLNPVFASDKLTGPLTAYSHIMRMAASHTYPSPSVLGKLINILGRQGEAEKVIALYNIAQNALAAIEYDKRWQTESWFLVEDSMIIALAHYGDVDSAHAHRARILEQGGAPSADAYGALIAGIRDTTDDATVAIELYEESQRLGVPPNVFLFNTTISKLAKARKAEYALELFRVMTQSSVRPTSVTYGAIIGACCRVGDGDAAERYFEEMMKAKGYKPRVPPFNTMIQFFVNTKPSRERALYYYNALLRNQIRPTAHTYKLMLDCYGAIEPVDTRSMEQVFARIVSDSSVKVQGTHWAALINSWGCISKDLDKAIAIFDSIATHPSTARSATAMPDAVVYEAMINVLVTNKRMDLIPTYLERLRNSNVHMTAYIANFVIKGYAALGDVTRAREVFESLQDPPTGVAASHNHASHEGDSTAPVDPSAPVYREPSTWEAMVRAELGAGERQRALDLLERMDHRMFPPAVVTRIRGIVRGDDIASSP